MSDDIVGIDLGTTNSLIGVMEAGFPILLADANGARLTPSVVHFPETGEPLVGAAASRMRALQPQTTVYSAKRLIGCRTDDIASSELPAITRSLGREASRSASGSATGSFFPRKSRRSCWEN